MELKAELKKPFDDNDRYNFLIKQNQMLGYIIKETDDSLQAWGKDDEEMLEYQMLTVRKVRNHLLERYVDPAQKILVWESLSDDDKLLYKAYRQYLLDYTLTEKWWENNPLEYEDWKATI